MTNKLMKTLFFSLTFFLAASLLPLDAFCQQPQSLEEGVIQYKAGKYEEAINTLTKARQEDPQSSNVAFLLGLAYKQTMDYENAYIHLKDAVTMPPKIKEALIELIDVSLQIGKIDEAGKWIAVAEEENILPAKTAFLKGILLTEEGKNKEAAASFEKAKTIDPKIAQASDIQIALSHLRESELKNAKESFQSAITVDPQSDMAGFARQYLAKVEETLAAQRPLHVTLSLFEQYDDNMVLKPTDESLATGVTNQASMVTNSALRVNYSPRLKGPWLFNAYYGISSSLHQKHKYTHDSLSNTLSMTPGYSFGKYALNLSTTYTYALVRNPGYEKYSSNLNVGPMMRIAVKSDQLLEIFAGYADNKYYQPTFSPDENRDSSGIVSYASWVWLFKKNSFLNLRYQFQDQNAKGRNWDNTSHTLSANAVIPVSDNVKLQVNGQAIDEKFTNTHTVFDLKREDKIYNLSGGASWDFIKNASLIGQYTWIRNGSNIGIYDYSRNLFTLGLEYKF
jgi:tetratricopeptide (TPR) repeat protein